jgi:hypothetical protein
MVLLALMVLLAQMVLLGKQGARLSSLPQHSTSL